MSENTDTQNAVLAYLSGGMPDPASSTKLSVSNALDTNPDYEAELQRVAKQTGVPIDTARNYPDDIKKQAQMGQLNVDSLVKQFPKTARFLADQNNANVAHDDVNNLSLVEQNVNTLQTTVRSFGRFLGDIPAAAYGVGEGVAKAVAPLFDPLAGTILPENPIRRLAAGLEQFRKQSDQAANIIQGPIDPNANLIQKNVYNAATSFGQQLPGLAMTLATKNPAYMLTNAGVVQGGQSVSQALDQGAPPATALLKGGADAAAEVFFEKFGVDKLLGDVAANSGLFKTFIGQAVREIPGEAATTLVQQANDWALLNPNQSMSDFVAQLGPAERDTVLTTVFQTVMTAGLGHSVSTMQHEAERAAQAGHNAEVLGKLNEVAKASKLKGRATDTFEQFVKSAAEDGPVQDVYIDANVLNQSENLNQIVQASPSIAEQLPLATATGGMVQVPLSEFAGKLAGTDFAQSLIPHLKTEPDGMSQVEAQTYMQSHAEQLAQEVQKSVQNAQDQATAQSQVDEVKGQIKSELDAVNRFTPAVNDSYATLMSNFFAVQAAKLGISPNELYQRYKPSFTAQSLVGENVFNQEKFADTSSQLDNQGQTQKATPQTTAAASVADTLRPTSKNDLGGSQIVVGKTNARNDLFQSESGSNARGSFNPANNTISLFKNADLSTTLHEFGHFFLETQFDIANKIAQDTTDPGEQQLLSDSQTLLNWFGVNSLAEWNALPFEEKRSYHEQFARGFESYLFEGKSPNIEMQGLFQRFRAWLVNVYKDIKNLNVSLTPEVRQVMDRMLASSEEIQLMRQAGSMSALFNTPEQAGMTPEEFARYHSEDTQSTADAVDYLQQRSLRDMSWFENAKGREIKRLQKEAAGKRREVQAEVRGQVMQEPIYQAWQFLTGKVEGPDTPIGKLSTEALADMYGGKTESGFDRYAQLDWKRLTDQRMTAKDGAHPDVVAEMFGFSSGDELVKKLLEANTPQQQIAELTDVAMLERYGELTSPEAIDRAANMALHNELRAKVLATEANALAKATGQPKVLAKLAKSQAAMVIGRLKVRDLKPSRFTAAETRAAKESTRASRAGDLTTAAAEKRNQLFNNYAAKAAFDAQGEIDKGLKYLKRFDTRNGSLDADYADQIEALLDRFDLRKSTTLKAIDKSKSLATWMASQEEQGLQPDIPEELLNETYRKSYKEMTVEEFRGLLDSVKQIEHLGRLKHRLLTAVDQKNYEAARDEIVSGIVQYANNRVANTRTPTTNLGNALQKAKSFWAAHIKVPTYARVMDGGKDGGPVWEYFIRTANDRANQESTMRAEATEKLSEIMAPVFAQGGMGGKGDYFSSIGRSLNRQERMAIALNWGNESNRQRLLGGEGWTPAQIQPVLESLSKAEWQAVQGVWDHFESYRPQIAAKERRVYGKEPEWIDPAPFTIQTKDGAEVDIKGGYYPVKYDPAASQRAEQHADAESAKRQLQGAYTSATTRRSFTKARVEEVKGRPLLYNLSGMYGGINDVIHDLTWHEWLIDANRLLRSNSIDTAIRNHYGPQVKRQFTTWVKDIAEGNRATQYELDNALSRVRQGVSAAGLGFNFMSAVMQPLGLTQSATRVGAKWIGKGVAQYIANPIQMTKQANELSDFMLNRNRTRFRELNELRNKVQGQSKFGEFVGDYAYFFMLRAQQMVDVPTWHGAYQKALAENNDEARAVALADQAVIDSQGGGEVKDLSAIERGGPAQKLFTVFYSFMNTALNLGVQKTMNADTPAKRAQLAVDYVMLYVAPPILGYFLKEALTPGGGGDDDWGTLAKKLAAEEVSYLMGLMVVVRELGEAAKLWTGASSSFSYQGPAGVRAVGDIQKLSQQAHQGEFDDAFRKAAVNVIGDFSGLPSAQVNRTITGAQAISEGQTQNPAALVFGFKKQ